MTGPRRGVAWEGSRLLRVTAHLQQGAVLPPVFPAPLDGILASAAHRQVLGQRYGHEHDPHVRDLPLATWRAGAGKQWVWAASCAHTDSDVREAHYWHKRTPHAVAEVVTGSHLPPTIYEGHGRYRHYRTPLAVTVTGQLRWWAVGDPDGVRALLGSVWCVGKKAAQGEGRVMAWHVTDEGSADAWPVLWSTGRIGRPMPARAAEALGLVDPDVVEHAVRPPYWRPPAGMDGDAKTRAYRTVIAPWTQPPGEVAGRGAAALTAPHRS